MSEQLAFDMAEVGLDVPQGYKRTEVGVIPEDWEVIKGGQLFSKIQDGTHFSPKVNGGKFLYVTSKNIKFGHLDLRSAEYIDQAQHEAIYKRCDVMKNDILLTKDGANTGNAALNTLDEPFSLLSSVAFLRLNENKHSSEFFLQQILSRDFQVYIQEEMSGNAITRLTLSKINNLIFFVPPLKEQTAIATALSDVDALINELEKLIAKKQAIKTATMQQLLTGRTRLPQFALRDDGTPKGYKASELGEIPEDWEVTSIGSCSELITKGTTPMTIGRSFVLQGITFVKVESVTETGSFDSNKFAYIDVETDRLISRSRIKENDLLISIAGALGRAAIATKEILPANTNQALAIVRLKNSSSLKLDYLYQFTKTRSFKQNIEEISSQGAQPNLSLGDLSRFLVSAPPTEEQTAIATILTDMDNDISSLQQRLSKTRQIKQGMMQQLLTGRIRLI